MQAVNTLFTPVKKNFLLTIVLLFCVFASLRILQSASFIQENHYVGLASSLLHGRLDIPNPTVFSATGDIALFHDKYYIYFGPTPAILILPLVFSLGTAISQQTLSLILFIFDFLILYKIARFFQITKSNSLWLVIFFIFGTIFFVTGFVNTTAFQVQFIATSFFLFALYEFFCKRRWLLIGILVALSATTRPTFYLSSLFFFLEILLTPAYLNKKIIKLFLLFLPIIISLFVIGYYNQKRFNNFLDSGYAYHSSLSQGMSEAVTHGIFSIKHVPGNLYFLLFKGPDPIRTNNSNFVLKFPYLRADNWGMGILFTSPLFIYLLFAKIKERYNLAATITILLLLIPAISYYGIGVYQYGYRYAIDFYPLLFIILLSVFKSGFPSPAKFLIIYSIIFNFFFALSVWGIYPFI